MYELIQLSEHDYYIACPAKIGVVRVNDRDVVLIDSGSDKDAGKKVLKILAEKGWTLKAVYNTHSHADHIGGNKILQDRTGCKIYAPGLDRVYTEHPELESIGLYGGLPFHDIENKFLLAQSSIAEPLTKEVLPTGFEILELPGHCFSMVGFRTGDNTVFLADSISSEETLSKYGIGYLWNPKQALETLEMLRHLDGKIYVPSHAEVCESITEPAEINAAAIRKVETDILRICKTGSTFETVLQTLFCEYGMTMTAQQYVLIGSTLRSYLSSMYTEGKLRFLFADNRMIWKTA